MMVEPQGGALSRGARVYLAYQPSYVGLLTDSRWRRAFARLHARISPDDLNPVCGRGRLFNHGPNLISAAYGIKLRYPLREPLLGGAIEDTMADSGGYQVNRGGLRLVYELKTQMAEFCDRRHVAVILDAPTLATLMWPKSGFQSIRECLTFTRLNGLETIRRRRIGGTKYCNVLQGLDENQDEWWFKHIRNLNDRRIYGERALDGFAMGGWTNLRFDIQLRHIVQIWNERLHSARPWLHWLGTARPDVVLLLTVIQEELRRQMGLPVMVSCDTATPFFLSGRLGRVFCFAQYGKRVTLRSVQAPNGPEFIGSKEPLGLATPIGRLLTHGDINVRGHDSGGCFDQLSYGLLAAHNAQVLVSAISNLVESYLSSRNKAGNLISPATREVIEIALCSAAQ